MCGIAGILRLATDAPLIDTARFRDAVAGLAHRGPDDQGFHLENNIALGFRRLSIVDLAGGHQPIANEDQSVWVVHNGEIYNHAELRAELTAAGHRFTSASDAEVLVHGYEAWGLEGLLSRLQGMFTFIIWDATRQMMYAARDRFGIKPLYYTETAGQLGLASEIRPLFTALRGEKKLDLDAFSIYLRIAFVPAPWTLFAGIRKLPAAHYLVAANGRWSTHCYWRLSYAPRVVTDERAVVEEFRERLLASVRAHLQGDVPIGALLSGGVDSGTLVSCLRRLRPEGFPVVSIGFADPAQDEKQRIIACATALGLPVTIREFDPDGMADYPRFMAAVEDPSWRMPFAALYRIYQTCRAQGLKVVLTGEGSDELLGGYSWHWRRPMARGLWNCCPPLLRAASSGAHPRLAAGIEQWRLFEESRRLSPRAVVQFYLRNLQVPALPEVTALLAPELRREMAARSVDELLAHWEDWVRETDNRDPFQQLLWLQSRTRLPDYINLIVDRMSMAHSVESRPPFLDHTLWEFCAGLPRHLKLRGYHPHHTEKYLLREAGRGLVPDVVRTHPKLGLDVPVRHWIAQKRLPDWAEEALSEPALRAAGLFAPVAVSKLRQRAQAKDDRRRRQLMVVLATQVWFQEFPCR